MIKQSFINIILRGTTLLCKFILLLFIAKFLTLEELGVFGIISTSVLLLIFVIGIDFYMHTTRDILRVSKSQLLCLIRDQFALNAIMFFISLPFLVLLFYSGFLPWMYFIFVTLIVIFDYISQECTRVFIALKKPVFANVILFLRMGGWIIVFITLYFLGFVSSSLVTILTFWIIGSFTSVLVAVLELLKYEKELVVIKAIDWAWIKKGLSVAKIFFFSTLSLKVIELSDRYILKYFHGDEAVGQYTFFYSIANVLQAFVFSGVVAVIYPKMIESYQRKRKLSLFANIRKLTLGTLYIILILSTALLLFMKPVLVVVGREGLLDYYDLFLLLIASTIVMVLSYIPHFALVAIEKEWLILKSTLISMIVSLTLNFLLIPSYGIYGAAISAIFAFTVLASIKTYYFRANVEAAF